ncbi:hypothetical protein EUGRSUZ_I01622 [Eucalyptus grandis]|uniref:Uncharacterized protein n=2 Tax=Eucalyptus grandis TaxID=71139 RepID=A0ACC3JII9_EUCGR|nr:hypothetical protein EUGRSUZ_I01622 [Eucalyptus grandis]
MAGHASTKEEGRHDVFFFFPVPVSLLRIFYCLQMGFYGRWPVAHSAHAFVTCEPPASPLVIVDFLLG